MSRGSTRLPRHMPPMNVPSRTPSDTADDPMISSSSWNQTTSYTSAAHPLPINNASSAGRYRREASGDSLMSTAMSTILLWAMWREQDSGTFYQMRSDAQARTHAAVHEARTEAGR